MVKKPRRFDVYLFDPTPADASEAAPGSRQCLIISPDKVNADPEVDTVVVAPVAASGIAYPERVKVRLNGKDSLIFLDYIATIKKSRLSKRFGKISKNEAQKVSDVFSEIFAF